MIAGQRVQHADESYACYGTVVRVEGAGWVLVLWDNWEDETPPDPEPSPERIDDLKCI
jgi:hypothetical protein